MSGMVKALLVLASFFALAALAWMAFLPALAQRELRQLTGFDVRVKVLTANPFTGRLVVRGLSALNPPTYPARDFLELRALEADVNLFSWAFQDQVTVNALNIDVEKLEVIRLHNGKTNLRDCVAGPNPKPATTVTGKPFHYLVKHLHVRLDQFVLADYTGSKPEVRSYHLNFDQSYTNISDPRQLIVPQVARTLYSFGLYHDVEQLLPGDLGKALADAVSGLSAVGSKAKSAAQKTGDYLKGLFDKLDHSSNP